MQWTDLLSNIERYTQQHKRSVSINSIDLIKRRFFATFKTQDLIFNEAERVC